MVMKPLHLEECKKIAKDIKEGEQETVYRNEGSRRTLSEKGQNVDVDEKKEKARNSQLRVRFLAEKCNASLCMMSNIVKNDLGYISVASKFVIISVIKIFQYYLIYL